jgi:hypothetical protein
MKYYVSYAFQRKPGDMAEFGCSVVRKENLDHGVSEDDLIELTNYLKNGIDKYSSVVILSMIPLCKNDYSIIEGDAE